MIPFGTDILPHLFLFGISAGLGALVGLEREQSQHKIAGLRTFIIITVLGTLTGLLSEHVGFWFSPAILVGIIAFLVTARFNLNTKENHVGRTTEITTLFSYAIGLLVWFGPIELAVSLGIGVTALLYFKPELHLVAQKLNRKDYVAILQFALIAFVILPILPDLGMGPFGVLNPYRIWLIVVLVSGLSLVGYVAFKFFGSRYGAPLVGFLGGLVSSTAASISFAKLSTQWRTTTPLLLSAIITANVIVYPRLMAELLIVNPLLARQLYIPFATLFLVGAGIAFYHFRLTPKNNLQKLPEVNNPANFFTSLQFGLIFALVLLLVAYFRNDFSSGGLTVITVLSSMTDLDAISLSLAELMHGGQLEAAFARNLILLATLVNLFFKFGFIAYFSKGKLNKQVGIGFGILAAITVVFMMVL